MPFLLVGGGSRVAAVLVGQGRGTAEIGGASGAVVHREALARSAVLVDVAGCCGEGAFAVQSVLLAGNELLVRDFGGATRAEGTVGPGGVGVDGAWAGSNILRARRKGSGYFKATVSLLRSSKVCWKVSMVEGGGHLGLISQYRVSLVKPHLR